MNLTMSQSVSHGEEFGTMFDILAGAKNRLDDISDAIEEMKSDLAELQSILNLADDIHGISVENQLRKIKKTGKPTRRNKKLLANKLRIAAKEGYARYFIGRKYCNQP